jgi:hypothetical protein
MNLEKIEKEANDYAKKVCNGQFPIEYTREQVVKHTKNDFMEGVKHILSPLPNEIDFLELKKLLAFSDRYEISIQFWSEQIAVYIAKDGVDLTDFGGNFDFAVGKAIKYLVRITSHNDRSKPKRSYGADFNIGDTVIYDGYTCMVKKKNRQKCLAIPMPMGWSYFIPNWADVKRP